MSRIACFIRGTLPGAAVVKLFLFDLSPVSDIERVVWFVGIGSMLLLIGNFWPSPPRIVAEETEQ